MAFKLTILGSSAALPTSEKFSTAQVLEVPGRFFLLDCGEGTQIQLRRNKVKFTRITDIFISHLHGDHFFGLPGLLSTLGMLGKKGYITIHAPKGIEELLGEIFKFAKSNFSYTLRFNVLDNYTDGETIFETKKVTVNTFRLKHTISTFGFIFKEKEIEQNILKEAISKYNLSYAEIIKIKRGENYITKNGDLIQNKDLTYKKQEGSSYAFLTDTSFYPQISNYIKNVKLLYHEATFSKKNSLEAKKTGHSTTIDAAEVAKLSNAKKLLIGHFSNRYEDISILEEEAKTVFENSIAAKENLSIEF